MPKEPPTRAHIAVPPWMWGGDPKSFLAKSDYHSRTDGGGSFSVQTNESYYRRRPDLVRLRTIAEPGDASPRWNDLAQLKERVEVAAPDRLGKVLERHRLKAEQNGGLLDLINHQRLLLQVLPVRDLPAQSRYFVESLNSVRFTEDPETGPFPNTGVYLIDVNPSLVHRLKIASVWLRIEQDVRLGNGDVSHIKTSNTAGGQAFASSAGLYDGVMMFDAYIAPLLVAGTPGIWAINIVRSFGSLIFSLGTFISGTEGDAAEMLQTIATPGATEVVNFPKLSASAGEGALRWWTARLNLLFSVLSDLSTFTNAEGNYRPAKHLEALLTIEQVFRRTVSMLVAHRDTNARRTLLFTILDSLEGVRGANLLTMCTLSHAKKVLAGLESSIPSDGAEILLPAARRAVVALRAMQDGFFIRSQLATETVDLQLDDEAHVRSLPPERAAALYLKVLRDATHGHGSDKKSSKATTAALLAHHDGEIPHDIGLLGYLYLLDLLMHPDRVRRLLYAQAK